MWIVTANPLYQSCGHGGGAPSIITRRMASGRRSCSALPTGSGWRQGRSCWESDINIFGAPFQSLRVGVASQTSIMSSFRLDAGRLDDRPPFLDLGLVKHSKYLWPAGHGAAQLVVHWALGRTAGRLFAYQILLCQVDAAIGHKLEARTGLFLKKHPRNMRYAADASRTRRCLVRIRLQPGDEPLQVVAGTEFLEMIN